MFNRCLIAIFIAASFSCMATDAPATKSTSASNEQAESLNLTYIHGGDYEIGTPLRTEDLNHEILSRPDLKELNLTGQFVSPEVMSTIHYQLPQLKKLSIRGYVRFDNSDGSYSESLSESLNEQEISLEMLLSLFPYDSPIEVLDLSLTTIDDNGLEQIGQGAQHLREIYLTGASNVTDTGINSLVDHLPNLKLIDLSKYLLRKPMGNQETIEPQISQDLIKDLSSRGIIIIQNDRTPWF